MTLSRLLDRTLRRRSAGSSRSVVLDAAGLHARMLAEQDLADRHGLAFALLAFRSARPADDLPVETLLVERARRSDHVGRLGDGRRALVLPCTDPAGARAVADRRLSELNDAGLPCEVAVYVYPRPGRRAPSPSIQDLGPLLEERPGTVRRAVDVLAASCALILLAPVLAAVALAVRLDSPGPVLFSQPRVGRGGRTFTFFKFRSMVVDAERLRTTLTADNEADGPIFKIRNDPRVTGVGRFIRRYSLDELPQLWNVLRGDMTLVGPRPPLPDEVRDYEPWQRRRLSATGGLTCLWQISGRSRLAFRDWARLDLRYLARRSPWLDALIVARTVGAVLRPQGAW